MYHNNLYCSKIYSTVCHLTHYHGYQTDCKSPLGFEDGRIKDAQLSASSYYHFFYIKRQNVDMKPKFARLNGPLAWCCPPTQSQQCHLTVDLGRVANISGIATQGIDGVGHYYVKTYKIRFGTDGVHWEHLGKNDTEKGKEKVSLLNVLLISEDIGCNPCLLQLQRITKRMYTKLGGHCRDFV